MDVKTIRRYQQVRRNDFNASIAALIGVLLLSPLYGMLAAVALAVLGLVYRSSRVDIEIMGKVPEEKAAWGSIRFHPERKTYPGVMVIRLDAPLFWANASEVADTVIRQVDEAENDAEGDGEDVKAVLLDLEATSQLDTTSVDALELIRTRLSERDIELYLVRVFYMARQVLTRSGFLDQLGEGRMWHSISAGVRAARKDLGLEEKSHAQVEENPDLAERIVKDGDGHTGGYADPVLPKKRWWQ